MSPKMDLSGDGETIDIFGMLGARFIFYWLRKLIRRRWKFARLQVGNRTDSDKKQISLVELFLTT